MLRRREKAGFLDQISLFAGLPPGDLETLSRCVREKRYRKGETLFHLDDPGTALFLIRSGRVKVSLANRDGKEIILRILSPGEFVGEMALLDGQPRSATVTAMENTEVSLLERSDFVRFIRQHPEAALKMLSVMSWRIRRSNDQIGVLAFSDAYGKVAQVLLDLIRDTGRRGEKGVEVLTDLTRQEMASLAGVTRETFTRILKAYENAGIIRIDRRCLQILSESRLLSEVL